MKKVLLSIIASFLLVGSAYAQPSVTIGLGMNQGVFAAEGTERNFDESGAFVSSTKEYGAFADSYPSIYIEVGNEFGSLGISLQDDISMEIYNSYVNFKNKISPWTKISNLSYLKTR